MHLADDDVPFPHPFYQTQDGLVAISSSLSTKRLVEAYTWGIFPWYDQKPVLWWCPLPRFMISFKYFKIPKSLRSLLKRHDYSVAINTSFRAVIEQCKTIKRPDQNGTWIDDDMMESYIELHHMGLAHSIEIWEGEELVGGLYGLAIGKIFYGESMFSKRSNVSKLAFVKLVELLKKHDFYAIDCQMETPLLKSFGGAYVDPLEFWSMIRNNLFIDQKYLDKQLTSGTQTI